MILKQGASEGVNREIGDGLRKHPERITDLMNDAEQAVVNGSFAYMNVNMAQCIFVYSCLMLRLY